MRKKLVMPVLVVLITLLTLVQFVGTTQSSSAAQVTATPAAETPAPAETPLPPPNRGCTACHVQIDPDGRYTLAWEAMERMKAQGKEHPPLPFETKVETCLTCHNGSVAKPLSSIVHPAHMFSPIFAEEFRGNCFSCHEIKDGEFTVLGEKQTVNDKGVIGATTAPAAKLTAVKADPAPKLDGIADDPIWTQATAATVNLAGGANLTGGNSTATLKAAYTADTLYMLIEYQDPTQSARRSPYVKQADGSWKKLTDPDDKGGDNNKYYEDKLAFIWTINNSIKGFNEQGCAVACHVGEAGKAFGNKYTASEGEIGDIWHWKSVRTGTVGQADDQFVDNTRYDKDKAPEAGRKSDAKTSGGYVDIKLVDGKPEFMSKDAKPANADGTYWLKDSDKVAFDDSKFKPGDEVAAILVAPFAGDRGDISAEAGWKDGKWTLELSRKLVTDSKTDVQFDKLDAVYYFGIAAFDNAQVRHAYNAGAVELVFSQ